MPIVCLLILILMSSAHSPTFASLHLRHNSFSNPSVFLPTPQLILQPFHCFTYVTVHSLIFLRFSYVAALHLIHLASRPCFSTVGPRYWYNDIMMIFSRGKMLGNLGLQADKKVAHKLKEHVKWSIYNIFGIGTRVSKIIRSWYNIVNWQELGNLW